MMSDSKVKILCLYKGSYPKGQAMANRLRNYADAICSENIDFTVASEGQKVKPTSEDVLFEGHKVLHWRTNSIWDKWPLIREVSAWLHRIKLYKYVVSHGEYDVLFSSGYRWPQMIVILFLAKITKKKYVVELNELPHSIKARRMDTPFSNAFKRFITLRCVFPFVDGFICISKELEELLEPIVPASCKVIRVPILTDVPTIPSNPSRLNSDFIFHAGTLTNFKDGIETVFEAYGKAVRENGLTLRYEFSNFNTLPAIKNKIRKIINRYELQELVTFHNYLSIEELHQKLESCYMVVINKPNNIRNKYNFSTKLGECMGYGIPIITTAYGDSAMFLRDHNNALIIRDSSDSDQIAVLMHTLHSDKGLAKQIGIEARKTAEQEFHYSNFSKPLQDYFLALKNG